MDLIIDMVVGLGSSMDGIAGWIMAEGMITDSELGPGSSYCDEPRKTDPIRIRYVSVRTCAPLI